MEMFLIALSGLASALSAVAFVVAVSSHLRRPIGLVLTFFASLGAAWIACWLLLFSFLEGRVLEAALFCALEVLGAAALVVWGRRAEGPGLPARALAWPRGRIALVLLLALAIFTTSTHNARLAARQTIEGRITELAALEQIWWPGVPPSLNAAPIYALAYRKLQPLSDVPGAHEAFDALWEKNSAPISLSRAPALIDWTQRNGAALALAIEGTQKPGYASVEDALWRGNPFGRSRESKILRLEMAKVGHDPQTLDNQLSRRRVGDLLMTRSLQRADAGDLPGAVQDANALLALAAQTGSPWLAPERLIERLIAAPGMTAGLLAQLQFPRGEGLEVNLQRTLIRNEHAELASGRDMRSLATWARAPRDPVDAIFMPINEVLGAERWNAEVERYYDDAWTAIEAPEAQRLEKMRAVMPPVGNGSGFLWTPDVLRFLERNIRDQAVRDCAEVGVAVARYRVDHGKWPEQLAQLVPDYRSELPLDAFNGAPLRYVTSVDEARVYSVGADLHDDGGISSSDDSAWLRERNIASTADAIRPGKTQPPSDVVFVVHQPR